jgi:2-polyprenyl-3-methyl-5-hydroxy-6-metoxy-1,4-benzoquinol methylase
MHATQQLEFRCVRITKKPNEKSEGSGFFGRTDVSGKFLKNYTSMDRYKETFETWNKIASLYQDKFMDLDLYNETYDFICNSILHGKAKVLEIGCGPGNITKYLLSKRPDFNIYGIDIAPNMIDLAKRNNPTANFGVMDSRQISELKMKFNGIVCGFCLPYLSMKDSAKLISDSAELLTDDGLIYISFVEGDPDKSGFQVGSTGDRSYFYFHNLDKLKAQLMVNEFEEPKIFKVEYIKSDFQIETHTILTAKKKKIV